MKITRPEQQEYDPYFKAYIDLVDLGDFETMFAANTERTIDFFANIPPNKHSYKYGVDKWTIKEVLMHIIDTERVFAYRALVCIRGDYKTVFCSMDDKLYASNVNVASRSMDSLINEFQVVRQNSGLLFKDITEEQSKFLGKGVSSNFSARALAWIMMGHILHHMNVIQERYL